MIFRRGMGRSYGEARTDGEEKGAGVVDAGEEGDEESGLLCLRVEATRALRDGEVFEMNRMGPGD